jgi:hypothetical protein
MMWLARRRALTRLCATYLVRTADIPMTAPARPALKVDQTGGELSGLMPSSDGRRILIDSEPALHVVDGARDVALRAPRKGHRDSAAPTQPLAEVLRFVVANWGAQGKAGAPGRLALLDVATKAAQTLTALAREPRPLVSGANEQRLVVSDSDSDEKVQMYDSGDSSRLGPIKLVVGQRSGKSLRPVLGLSKSNSDLGARRWKASSSVQISASSPADGIDTMQSGHPCA